MSCRAPVPPLDPLFDTWPAGQVIHVIHDTAFPPESFNPGVDQAGKLRKPTRFAPIRDAKGKVVPYLYGGSALDCAIFETVFHEVPIDAADKFVDLDSFAQHGYGQVIPNRDLKLVDLTSEGLHRLKVLKEELIASTARDYPLTARWAEALHRQCEDADGLLWMSRQRDRDQALVLFGDRLAGVLGGTCVGGPLERNPTLREAVVRAALRAGIDAD
ncbi:RES family NAD+ phosphorylase [Pusillimonas sp. CC-YST705]|uniref:RES family NAD+ phosphorylase n=1 Tax=Mesopusillimonas faecipullorum TaxID=2755040 RepID=A0ABS8CAL5_9BURK|nr:RES family NAD+ phosphorylase [Mesopusillimonas faecipullorum]MCB5363050.1 RES family NAD+ phosphorylase [Mesopusillimonas faecipullorum]